MNISIGNLGGSNPSVNELISQLVSKRTQSLNSLLEQKSSIENTLAALQSGGLGIGSLNNSYSSQIASLQDTIDRLNEQYTLNANKITTINSLKKSYNSTVTSLDKYLESLKNPNNAGKDLDIYLDGNKVSSNDKVNVTVNDKDTNIQEITLNVTQLATTSKLFSNVLIGGNVSENTLITDLFAGLYDETKNSITTNRQDIKESLKLSELGITSGSFNIGSSKITIDADTDTIGSVIQKIKDAGYNAQIVTKEFDSNGEAVGSFMISGADGKSIAITSQTTNFASQMGLTVSEGNFFINGAEFNITDTTTLGSLINDINAASADNVGAKLENGKLVFVASETGEVDINVEKGTSNFTNAIGFTVGGVMNTTNLVMGTDGSFVTLTGTKDGISSTDSVANGKFTAGNFNVYYNEVDEHGNVSDTLTKVIIEVTEDDTIESIIQKIEDQTKGSYVDEEGKTVQTGLTAAVVDGHFQIRQLQKGAEFSISVEAGSSNFTNYVGMTSAINAQTSKDAENSYVLGSVKVPASGFSEGSFTISTNKVSDDGKTALFEMATATITVEAGDTAESIAQKITDAGIGLTASVTEDGFFKIEQNNSGVDFDIKIEAGGTDFTYKAGLTTDIISTGVLSPGSTDLQYTSLTGSSEVDENTSVSGGTFKINGITININAGTISSAIDDINSYKDQTGVNAFLKDGHLVLQANETGPDHTLYIEGGTSNIGTVAGFLTKTETAAAATIGQNGSKSTLTGAYNVTEDSMITAGSIVINGYTINLNAGSLKDAITEINKHSSDTKVTASISNGKFVLTSTENGAVNITASAGTSNFAQVTGIAAYQSQAGTQEIIGASKTTLTAAATGLKETDAIGESVISINGQQMTLSGTLKSAINTINANSGFTGVEAYLDSQGRFVLQNVNTGSKGINFVSISGDFTRVIGAASSTTTAGSSSQVDRTPASMHGGTTGLELNTEIIGGGTLTINGHNISLDGISSINGVINAINSAKIGVTASLDDDGRFVVSALDPGQSLSVSYTGNGNFGYVAGIGSYTIGSASGSTGSPGTGGVQGGNNGSVTGSTEFGAGVIAPNDGVVSGGNNVCEPNYNNGVITGGNTVQGTAAPELSNTLTGSNTIEKTHLTEAEASAQGYILIRTAADLKKMSTSGKYMLVNDIDLSGTTWTPLFLNNEFTGTLDGNGYEIKNLKVDYSSSTNSSSYASLLGRTNGATIKDLGIQLNSINSSGGYIGALAGMAQNTNIINCYVTGGTVSSQGGTVVGGLVGCFSGTMTNSYSTASVWTSNTTAGGLVGTMTSGNISNSYATGPVVAHKGYVGGFIGSMNSGSITNSYSTGTVTANGSSDPTTTVNIGGFIGSIAGGNISNSYTTSNVNYSTGSTYIGIFAGNANNPSTMLSNNKALNNISGFGAIGNTNVQANSSQVELLPLDQFGNSSSFSGWSSTIWDFSGSIPRLKTIITEPSFATSKFKINGTEININGTNLGFTIEQAVNNINARTSSTGVEASIKNGKLVLESVNGTDGITIENVSGNFLDVVGIEETNTNPVTQIALITASEININGVDISLSASSVATALSTINSKTSQTGVVASIEGGKFILKNQDGSTDNIYFFNNSGNFAEVTGLEQTGRITEAEAKELGYTVIKSAQDLQNINNNLNGKYILMGDIDLSGVSWTQLGQFKGEFNGNGYTIKNLTSDTESAGLFSELYSATVRNLIIDNAEITGVDKAGAVAGDASQYSYIYNVSVINSDISAAGDNIAKVGGIIGNLQQSSTIYVANVANTSIGNNNDLYSVGGIAGYVQTSSAVSNAAVTGTTINGAYSGGIAGYMHAMSSISSAYVSDTVTVTGSTGAGGVVASTTYNGNTISNAYVSASINCSNRAGGFAGYAIGLTVSDSYFDGSMSQSGAALIHTGHNAYGQVSIVNSGWASTASSGYAVTKDYVDPQEYNGATPTSSNTSSLSKENLYNKVKNLDWNETFWNFSGSKPEFKNNFGYGYKDVSAGMININGQSINIDAGDISNAIDAINAVSSTTGVVASIESGSVVLKNADGSDKQIVINSCTSDFLDVAGIEKAGADSMASVQRLSESEAIAQGYTIIKTADDLKNIENNLSGKYILMGNINLSGSDWTPIGMTEAFTGELNGNGFSIFNMNITNQKQTGGLFGVVEGATIRNLDINNASIITEGKAGILAASATDVTVQNVHVSGVIDGLGNNAKSPIVGGLFGRAENYNISTSSADVELSGGTVGGLVGTSIGGNNITNSYATGTVEGFDDTNAGTTTLRHLNYIGGIVGLLRIGTTNISNSYASIEIQGVEIPQYGQIIGYVVDVGEYSISNSFWNKDANSSTNTAVGFEELGLTTEAPVGGSIGSIDPGSISFDFPKGLTAEQFADSSNFTGWDTDIWDFSGSMPVLKNIMTSASSSGSSSQSISAGTVTLNGQTIDIAGGSIDDVISQINSQSGTTGVVASLNSNNQLVFKNDDGSTDHIVIKEGTSNLLDVAGIQEQAELEGMYTTLTGGRDVTNAVFNEGQITINKNGQNIVVDIDANSTAQDVVDAINAADSGIIASLVNKDGKQYMQIKSTTAGADNLYISVSKGNFGALTGLASSYIAPPTFSSQSGYKTTIKSNYYIYQADSTKTFLDGSITINGTKFEAAGKTLQQVVDEINASGLGVTATLTSAVDNNGDTYQTFSLSKTASTADASKFTVSTDGDFARVVGLGAYSTGAGVQGVTTPSVSTPQGGSQLTGSFDVTHVNKTEEEFERMGYTVIKTANDLINIKNNLSGNYVLMDDIDLSGYNFTGAVITGTFTGQFIGNGYTISNMTINAKPGNVGLFEYTKGATIASVNFKDVNITGICATAGALVGVAEDTLIVSVNVDFGENGISTNAYVGGIAGLLKSGSRIGFSSTVGGTIESKANSSLSQGNYGGLAGQVLDNSTIYNSYSTVDITGNWIGGIAGHVDSGSTIESSFHNGTVDGLGGGIAASVQDSTIKNSFYNSNKASQDFESFDSSSSTVTMPSGQSAGLVDSDFANPETFTNAGFGTSWDFSGDMPTLIPPTLANISAGSIVINGTTINLSAGAISNAISKINSYSDETGVTASINENGNVVLESDGALEVKSGTSDFFAVAGIITENTRITEEQAADMGYTVITTAEQFLTSIKANPSGKYILMNNIDMSTYSSDWSSLMQGVDFKGTLNGNGYTVSNFSSTRSDSDNGGALFDSVENATITDITFTNAHVTSEEGGLFGETISGSTIANVAIVNSTITASKYDGGGLAAIISRSELTNIRIDNVDIIALEGRVGGIAGDISNYSKVNNAYVNADVISYDGYNTGGIAGQTYDSTFYNIYSSGTVKSNVSNNAGQSAGGLFGGVGDTIITNAYSDADISSNATSTSPSASIGGLIGDIMTVTIENAYFDGTISGNFRYKGAVFGELHNTTADQISNVIFNSSKVTEEAVGYLSNSTVNEDEISGLSDSAFHSESTFAALGSSNWYVTDQTKTPGLTFEASVTGGQSVAKMSYEEAISAGYTVITTAQQLASIAPDGKYILMADIDVSDYEPALGSASYIGCIFSGTLDGNGFKIKNLNTSLFYQTEGATLTNLKLENVNIPSSASTAETGALVRVANNTNISYSSVSGVVGYGGVSGVNAPFAGMLVGVMTGGSISYSSSSGVVGGTCVGGLVGVLGYNAEIKHSYSTATVIGPQTASSSGWVGGLVGKATNQVSITNNIFAGKIDTAIDYDKKQFLVRCGQCLCIV